MPVGSGDALSVLRVWFLKCLSVAAYRRRCFVTSRFVSGGHQQWPIGFGAGREGCGPSQPRFADIHTASRRRRSGRPPGNRPAMAHRFRCRPGDAVPRSRGSPISTPPHGADGADALQGIGQQMPHRFRSRPEGSAVSRSRYSGNRLPLVNGTHLAARAAVWRTSTGLKAQGFVHLDVTFSFQSCPTDWDR
jgi:hypothetical protein